MSLGLRRSSLFCNSSLCIVRDLSCIRITNSSGNFMKGTGLDSRCWSRTTKAVGFVSIARSRRISSCNPRLSPLLSSLLLCAHMTILPCFAIVACLALALSQNDTFFQLAFLYTSQNMTFILRFLMMRYHCLSS